MILNDFKKKILHLDTDIPDDLIAAMQLHFPFTPSKLLFSEKSTSKLKQFLHPTNKSHMEIYQRKYIENILIYNRNKALIDKYLLPPYFPKDYNEKDIFEEVQIRDYLITTKMSFEEAKKKVKSNDCKDKETFKRIMHINMAMWSFIKRYQLLSPYKWYYFHRLEEAIETKEQQTKEAILAEWNQLPEDKKMYALQQATKENNVRKAYTLIHNVTNFTINNPRTYLQIYIDELVINHLGSEKMTINIDEAVQKFKTLSNIEKMKYIKEAHIEKIIYNYIKIAKKRNDFSYILSPKPKSKKKKKKN